MTGNFGANARSQQGLVQLMVSAIWVIAAVSTWREARRTKSSFDSGLACMLVTLAQSRLALALAAMYGGSWLVASHLFRFGAVGITPGKQIGLLVMTVIMIDASTGVL